MGTTRIRDRTPYISKVSDSSIVSMSKLPLAEIVTSKSGNIYVKKLSAVPDDLRIEFEDEVEYMEDDDLKFEEELEFDEDDDETK